MWLWDHDNNTCINAKKVSYYEIKKSKSFRNTDNVEVEYEYNVIAIMDNGDTVWLRKFKRKEDAKDFIKKLIKWG